MTTFYIYRDGKDFILSDGEQAITFGIEGEAIDAAVRIAQETGALYKINYWKPIEGIEA